MKKTNLPARAARVSTLVLVSVLAACGGSDGSGTPGSVTVGGTVTGLSAAGLVLASNGTERIEVSENGPFSFATPVAAGAASTVTVELQPPWQQCTVANGATVAVTCVDVPARFAYTPNSGTDNVSMYTVAAATGLLVRNSPRTISSGPFQSHPSVIAADRMGRFVVAGNEFAGTVASYAVDTSTGLLTAAPGSPVAVGSGGLVTGVAVHPQGRFAYAAAGEVVPLAIDPATGALTPLAATTGFLATDIVFSPTGRFAFVASSGDLRVFRVDATTGALTPVAGSPFPVLQNASQLVMHPGGKFLLGVSRVDGKVASVRIDAATGAVTAVTSLALPGAVSVAVHPGGTWVYAIEGGTSSQVHPLSLDGGGVLTTAGPAVPADTGAARAKVDPGGRVLQVAIAGDTRVQAFGLDPVTGAPTLLSPNNPVGGISASGPSDLAFVR